MFATWERRQFYILLKPGYNQLLRNSLFSWSLNDSRCVVDKISYQTFQHTLYGYAERDPITANANYYYF